MNVYIYTPKVIVEFILLQKSKNILPLCTTFLHSCCHWLFIEVSCVYCDLFLLFHSFYSHSVPWLLFCKWCFILDIPFTFFLLPARFFMYFLHTVSHYLDSCSAHDVSFTTQSVLYMCVVPCLFLPQCVITSTLVPQMTFHSRHKASLTVATLLSDLRDIHYLAFFGIKASQQKSFSSLNAVWLPFGCDGSFTKIGDCCPLWIPGAMISKRGWHFYLGRTVHAVLSCDCCVLALFLLFLLCSRAVLVVIVVFSRCS